MSLYILAYNRYIGNAICITLLISFIRHLLSKLLTVLYLFPIFNYLYGSRFEKKICVLFYAGLFLVLWLKSFQNTPIS